MRLGRKTVSPSRRLRVPPGDIFNPVKWQKKAVEDCGGGDHRACVAVPIAMPYALMAGVMGAPIMFPLLTVVYAYNGYSHEPSTTPAGATASDAPWGAASCTQLSSGRTIYVAVCGAPGELSRWT